MQAFSSELTWANSIRNGNIMIFQCPALLSWLPLHDLDFHLLIQAALPLGNSSQQHLLRLSKNLLGMAGSASQPLRLTRLYFDTGSLPESPSPMADSEGLLVLRSGKGAKPGMAFIHLFVVHQHCWSLCNCLLGFILIKFREQVLRLHGISLELHWAVHH